VRAQVLDQGLVEARHWGNRSFDRRCRRIARRGSGAVAPILRQECCACNYFARTEHRGDTVGAAPGILRRMRLQPNPPRLITVALALVLGGVGLAYAWPIDSLVSVLTPLTDLLGQVGL